MDFWQVLQERKSSRQFKVDQVEDDKLIKILEFATMAPSPLNRQPWEFTVVRNAELKELMYQSANKTKELWYQISGWKWLDKYKADFLLQAPVIIAIIGDPKKTGADQLAHDRGEGYEHACAAAVQNMLLAAQALGLGSLWFTLFDKLEMAELLNVEPGKNIIALVCIGYSDDQFPQPKRQGLEHKVKYIN